MADTVTTLVNTDVRWSFRVPTATDTKPLRPNPCKHAVRHREQCHSVRYLQNVGCTCTVILITIGKTVKSCHAVEHPWVTNKRTERTTLDNNVGYLRL